MAIMDVSVVLRLVDQLSGLAKKTADALRQIVDTTKQLKGAGGLDSIGKSITNAAGATSKLRTEIRSLAGDYQRIVSLSRNAMVGGANRSWANQQVAAWRQVLQAGSSPRLSIAHWQTVRTQGAWHEQEPATAS